MNPKRQRGAALLLMVAMLGMGAAALRINAFSRSSAEARRVQRTLQTLGQARDALVGFAVLHGLLPRPAISALDGRESPGPCDSEAACNGFLPWVALGVDGGDAWGSLLRYSVTPAMTDAPVHPDRAIASKIVMYRDSAGQLRSRIGNAPCTLRVRCAPLVLLSTGPRNFGTSVLGVPQANTGVGNIDEAANASGLVVFVERNAGDAPGLPGGAFDDLVTWVPLSLLYNRMNSAQQLP